MAMPIEMLKKGMDKFKGSEKGGKPSVKGKSPFPPKKGAEEAMPAKKGGFPFKKKGC